MFLLIDKPKGITSHDVVDEVRKVTGERRVGHAGTLDPNATGLLIVGVGRESTKKLGIIAKGTKKTYLAEIVLGEERDTDDVLGKIKSLKLKVQNHISKLIIENILSTFLGEQEQVPPQYSAIKIKGKKAYELARRGERFKLKPRKINIYSIKLIKYEYPLLEISTEVSSGTYIRSLARDVGRKLGAGAYLGNLRRIKIGKWDVSDAINLNDLNSADWKSNTVNI